MLPVTTYLLYWVSGALSPAKLALPLLFLQDHVVVVDREQDHIALLDP